MLAEPLTRLVYQRGAFGASSTDEVSEALFWFSFSLPFSGANLLLTRTFFSLQRPWFPTALAGASLLVNLGVSLALYEPLRHRRHRHRHRGRRARRWPSPRPYFLRRQLHGFEIGRTLRAVAGILVASALLGVVSYEVWDLLDDALGALAAGPARVGRSARWRSAARSTPAPCSRSGSRRRTRSSA